MSVVNRMLLFFKHDCFSCFCFEYLVAVVNKFLNMIVSVVFVFNIWLLLFVYVWHCVAFSTICLFAFAWLV